MRKQLPKVVSQFITTHTFSWTKFLKRRRAYPAQKLKRCLVWVHTLRPYVLISSESDVFQGGPAHEELLFIITHQVWRRSASLLYPTKVAKTRKLVMSQAYELWFKQILHEVISVQAMFKPAQVNLDAAMLHR